MKNKQVFIYKVQACAGMFLICVKPLYVNTWGLEYKHCSNKEFGPLFL